ncbi:enoyl-CoA hydratase/carnithine racemase [Oxalobacteraceae bacterium GrIS 2.11]
MDILTNKQDGVLTISFNRPAKKNAITAAMYQTMADALRDAETDNEVRVILFTGQDNIFTAGNDLEDFMKNASQLATDGEASSIIQFMRALSASPKPIIAAVAGLAVGIGTTMLMHCDLIYLADNAKLTMPFSQLGLCPEFSSSILLQRVAGYHRAAEKLLFGEPFGAEEAMQLGLANKIVPAAELLEFATQQAAKLVALPAASLRATKRLMKASQTSLINEVMQEELKQFSVMLSGPEAKEAFMAFFQKRKPDFSQFS